MINALLHVIYKCYLHSSGASFGFLFLFLHLGRAISYGSYFYNPNTWFSGILLFLLLMTTAFLGYVLPFDSWVNSGTTIHKEANRQELLFIIHLLIYYY